tara:strand:- start:83547 stop:84143 length:597 start_codon:yes stop_codon:yes gene_type:complete
LILESIVTTVDPSGQVNVAPMGPQVDESDAPDWNRFVLKPFHTSTTFHNLHATRRAVIHITDDASLFARAAVDTIAHEEAVEKFVRPLDGSSSWILRDCHRWFAVEIESEVNDGPRAQFTCRVVDSGVVRPFFGFNRAKHAVIEAAILATRVHLIPASSLIEQLELLKPLVEKTGGTAERDAFQMLQNTVHARIAENN